MERAYFIIHFFISSLVAGLAGTLGMTLFVEAFSRRGLIKVDLVRAIGSIFTRTNENALLVGSVVHGVSGIFFAMVYTTLLSVLGIEGTFYLTLVGTLIGLAHGFILSFWLIISVAEHHPLAEYREVGFGIAVVYLVAHIIYGACVGLVVGLMGFLD